jgi:hypothetical protein
LEDGSEKLLLFRLLIHAAMPADMTPKILLRSRACSYLFAYDLQQATESEPLVYGVDIAFERAHACDKLLEFSLMVDICTTYGR